MISIGILVLAPRIMENSKQLHNLCIHPAKTRGNTKAVFAHTGPMSHSMNAIPG